MVLEMQRMAESQQRVQKELRFDMETVQEQLRDADQEARRQRIATKKELREQCQRLGERISDCGFEFRRTNSCLAALEGQIGSLVQDSILVQMLQEQELIDRKQIALFGVKTNHQILGKNHHAMTNNLTPSSPKGPESSSFWAVRHKKESKRANPLAQSLQLDEIKRPQTQLSTLRPGNGPTSPTEASVRESDVNRSFKDRYNDTQLYNTIKVDRNCASCMTGFAP